MRTVSRSKTLATVTLVALVLTQLSSYNLPLFEAQVSATGSSGGCNPDRDLSGEIIDGDRTGRIRNTSANCSYDVGYASYKRFGSDLEDQELFDYKLKRIGPKQTIDLTIDLPQCTYQTDLFYGALLQDFKNGKRYGDRKLDSAIGGKGNCDGNPGECPLEDRPIYGHDTEDFPNYFDFRTPGDDGDSMIIMGRGGNVVINQGDDDTVTINQTVDIPVFAGEELFWQGVDGHFNPMLSVDYLDANGSLIQRLDFDDIPRNNDRSLHVSGPNDEGTASEKTIRLSQDGTLRFKKGTRSSEHAQLTLRTIEDRNHPDCPQPEKPQLTIEKSGPATVVAGQRISYTITVRNTGKGDISGFISDRIPSGLTYNASLSTQGCAVQGDSVVCNNVSLSPNQSKSFTFVFDVTTDPRICNAELENVAKASFAIVSKKCYIYPGTGCDMVHAESQKVKTVVQCPATDISIVKEGPATAVRGDQFTYSFTVRNNGSTAAENVVVSDTIPSGLTIQQVSSNCSVSGQVVTCSLGTLQGGEQRSLAVLVRSAATSDHNCATTSVTNTGKVTTTSTDTNSSNNQSSVTTQLTCANTDVKIQKSGPSSVERGQSFTYTLTATNLGNITAQNVVISDTVPSTLTIQQVSSGCSVSGNTVSCPIGTLAAGESRSVSISVTAPLTQGSCSTTNVTNTGFVSSTNDTNNANNQSSVTTQVTCPPPQLGCIEIRKEAFDPSGVRLNVVPQFQFRLNGNQTVLNNSQGNARFDNVPVGSHQISETLPAGWELLSANPQTVQVQGGTNCAKVTFQNKQILQTTDVKIVKTGPATVQRGNAFTYILTVQNLGSIAAQNVQVADSIPSGLTITQIPTGCTQNGNNVSCVIGTLPAGESRQIAIAVTAPTIAHNCSTVYVSNTGVVSSTNDSNASNNQSSVSTQITCPPVLTGCIEILKETFDHNGSRIHQVIPFTFKLDNNQSTTNDAQGNARFDNVSLGMHTVSEVLPQGWELFNVTPANGIVQVEAGQDCAGVIFKNKKITPPSADLRIVKTGASSVQRGNNLTYTLTITNLGPATAQSVTIADAVPNGLTISSVSSGCTLNGNNLTCNLNTLAVNDSRTITIVANAPLIANCTTTNVTNIAYVSSQTQDPNLNNNQSSVSTQITCPNTDVSIVKQGPVSALRGEQFTYSLIVRNNGQINAQNVVVSDNIPSGLTIQQVSSNCSVNGQTVTCTLGTLTANEQRSMNILVRSSAATYDNCTVTTITNTGTVSTTSTDTNPNNNQSTVTTQLTCPVAEHSDVVIQKSGPSTVVRGNTITYTLNVQNLGPAAAQNVIVSDTLPSGLTLVSASNSCTTNGNTVTCSLGTLAKNENRQITITATVPTIEHNCSTTTVTNTGTVTSTNDSNLGNNQSSVTTQVTCPPVLTGCIEILKETFDPNGTKITPVAQFTFKLDNNQTTLNDSQGRATFSNVSVGTHRVSEVLPQGWELFNVTPLNGTVQVQAGSNCAGVVFKNKQVVAPTSDIRIQKTGPSTVLRGNTVTYSLTVTNHGNAAAQNVVVTDAVPSALTIQSVSQGCTVNGQNVTCNVGTVAVNETKTITITTLAPTIAQNCAPTSVTNTGVVSSTNDANTSNNQSTVETQITCPVPNTADIQILKSGPSTVQRANSFTYTLQVQNLGTGTAQGVVVTDTIPSALTITSATTGCTINGQTVTCTLGTMTVNEQRSIAITVGVPALLPKDCETTSVTNTGTVTSSTQDPNQNNNQSSVTTQITCQPQQNPDLSIMKTGPSSVIRGDSFTYTLTIQNIGAGEASGVNVTDVLPSGTTFVSATSGCTLNGSTVTCPLGTIAANQTRTVTITVATAAQPLNCQTATLSNTGTVSTTSTDSNQSNNQSTITTQVTCPVVQNGCIDIVKETYNTAGNILTPVTQFTFSLDGTRTVVNDSQGHARFENVPVGSHTVTETIPNGWNQQLVTPAGGNVTVTAGTTCATVTFKNKQNTIAQGEADFSITKTDGRSRAEPGDELTYTITVRNIGSARATNVTVTDDLPEEVDFIDASPNASENGRFITWENQTFEVGETKTYEIEVEIDDDADGTLINHASVQNRTARDETEIDEDEDDDDDDDDDFEIDLVKTASTAEVFPGGIIDYTVTIENTGDGTLKNIVLKDTLPGDVIILDDGDADDRNGRVLEWEIDELDEGDEESFSYRISVPTYATPGQIIRNEVCVEADDVDEECESVTVIVLGTVPKTGAKLRLAASTANLSPVAQSETSGGGFGALMLLALMGMGTGTGIGIGRKVLLGF